MVTGEETEREGSRMKRILTDRLFVAGAIMAAVGIIAAGLQGQQPPTLFGALQALNGDGATKEEFRRQYQLLDSHDSHLSLSLALVLPWLVSGEAAERIYTNVTVMARTGGGTVTPPRLGGSVTNLTITSFNLGTTSLFIRAEWPLDLDIPWGWLELMGKLDLADDDREWDYLTFIDVDQPQGFVECEIRFSRLSWYYADDIDFSKVAFFRLQIPEVPEDWDWEPVDDDDGDPPGFPPPLEQAPPIGWFSLRGSSEETRTLSETFQAVPGVLYLIAVTCFDFDVLAPYSMVSPPRPPRNSVFSWTITAPGSDPMTGGTDTYALAAIYDETGDAYHRDFWLISIPTNATRGSIQMNASIVPDAPPGRVGGSYVDFGIRPICVQQSNMPVSALQDPKGSTDNAGHSSAWLTEGGTAFITGQPQPPVLYASYSLAYEGAPSFSWRMTVETERGDYRGTLDNRVYPTNGLYTAYTNTTWLNITQDLMNNEMVGGNCTLYCKMKDTEGKETEKQFKFKIRGMNPKDADVEAYAKAMMPDFCKSYAWAILRHESYEPKTKHVYNQFNTVEDKKLKWTPNKTSDTKDDKGNPIKQYGWGISQIDRSRDTPPGTVSTAEVWNWRTNVLAGAQTFIDKRVAYTNMLRRIKERYPSQWEDPPATTVKHGVTWTHEQWAVTVLYNKSTGVRPTTVWKQDVNGNSTGKDVYIECPLRFDPDQPAGQRWTFEDNVRKYAQQIAPYLPPNTPPVAPE